MNGLPVWRINLLRGGYLLLVVGLGLTIWPSILDPGRQWALMNGVVTCMLGAMSGLAVLGLRYPLAMMPLLLFEIGWKLLWLLRVALPLWATDRLDSATAETVWECLGVIVMIAVIPWRYLVRRLTHLPADPWRAVPARSLP